MTLLRWLTFLLGSQADSDSPALLDLFISSDAGICSAMAFPPLGNSDHVVFSVSIAFPSNLQQDAPFHCIAYGYSCADWDSLPDHLEMFYGRISLSLVLLLLLMNFVSGFRLELIFIYPSKYQVKSHSSPWFSAACAAAIVHRYHFFRLDLKDKSSDSVQTG